MKGGFAQKASVMKSHTGAELGKLDNQATVNSVRAEKAVQEAGLKSIAGEGLRKRCWQHRTEVLACMLTWNGRN